MQDNVQSEGSKSPQELKGLLAEFDDQDALLEAARAVRESGVRRWDTHTPFPVHGIERAMGIRATRLPWLVLVAGVTGGVLGLLLQWWTNAVDYPLNISGKPIFSLPANIPVTFELIILFAAAVAFGGAIALNGLPRFSNPLLGQEQFRRATTDRFFVSIDASDPAFDRKALGELCQSLGAISVEDVHGPKTTAKLPMTVHLVGILVVIVALIPPLWIAKERRTQSDTLRVHPVRDMDFQPRFQTQAATTLFADGHTMRPPVPGTVAEGDLREDDHFYRGLVGDEQFADDFPGQFQPITMAHMRRGQERYDIYCATCHGLAGEGDGITSQRALNRADSPGWVKPLSLHAASVREQPVGKIYNTITNGIRTMPGYASQIPPRDRWAIVLYVLALQRSQNGTLQDLPAEQREVLEMRAMD
jgi:mono/diheme cytochrome c family protein